ncbi:MAG: SGNH/GDSL hydrolase family protein [Clostridia bacterium]|nr:SGNH/GDSL hydrolase family protein [Clostridia bacterium]
MMNNNHWNEKTWYVYGTSMSNPDWGGYVETVEKLSGLKVVNNSIPGGSITPSGYGKGNLKPRIMNMDDGKENADLITLELLPNEGAPVGDIYAEDNESFCGCFNQCIRYLQKNTNAQIVVIIMIGGNQQRPEIPYNGRGITEFEFAEIIERVAHFNGVPVINAFAESGFGWARVADRKYQVDQIHFNEVGRLNMGKYIWSKLKDIPTWETEIIDD